MLQDSVVSASLYLRLINELPKDKLTAKFKQLQINKPATQLILKNRPFASENALNAVKGVASKTIEKLQTLPTLTDEVSKSAAVKPKPTKQTTSITPVTAMQDTANDDFLATLNQMDKVELFFKMKRATNLNDKKINQLIDNRPYQALSEIKAVSKKNLENIEMLLMER